VRFADGLKPLVQLACQLDASDGAKEASRLAIKNLCEGEHSEMRYIIVRVYTEHIAYELNW
jgi:hypothetical protein